MGSLFALMIKSACLTLAFYLIYRLLLCRDTFYRFNGATIKFMAVCSILLPLWGQYAHMDFGFQADASADVSVAVGQVMGIVEEDSTTTAISWFSWTLLIYTVGLVFFLSRTIINYLSLANIVRRGERKLLSQYGIEGLDDVRLIVHHDKTSPFSWMNYIVINEQDLLENGQVIVAHEMGHIRNHHTHDLIVSELFCILQWFNPAAWLLRRELQTVHEYIADEEVLNQGIDARQYQLLLIEKATGTRLQSITCSLHQSSIKKRITMMLTKKSNPWAKAKMLFAIPVAITGIAVFSTPEANAITSEVSGCKVSEIFANSQENPQESTTQQQYPEQISPELTNSDLLIRVNAKGDILMNEDYVRLSDLPAKLKAANLRDNAVAKLLVDSQTPMGIVTNIKETLRENGVTRFQYLKKDQTTNRTFGKTIDETPKKESKAESAGDDAFIICEKMPEFPGGEQALMEFIRTNLKYPADCAKQGIQGRVILEFIIEKDGSICEDIKVMRNPDDRLSAEAIRVVQLMPNWTPGQQRGQNVRVKYVLPIVFRLS